MATSNLLSLTSAREEKLRFTVRQTDHQVFSRLLAERRLRADDLLFDARFHKTQGSLREEARAAHMGVWLDTQTMELALPYSVSGSHRELPWAALPSTPGGFTLSHISMGSREISRFAIGGGYSTILAPNHLIKDSRDEDWLQVDLELAQGLKRNLTAAGSSIELVYPLATSTQMLKDYGFRQRLIHFFKELPIAAVSLRIHPFGHDAGPQVVRSMIESLGHLRGCGRPFMIERAGFAGLILLGAGAVDHVEAGMTTGDSFDVGSRLRPGSGKRSGGPKQRVYIEALGMTVDLTVANELMEPSRGKRRFSCSDPSCCPSGARDMTRDPRRHSILAKQRDFSRLAQVPRAHRGMHLAKSMLGPVCDALSRAGETDERFKKLHRRALSVKETLLAMFKETQARLPADTASTEPPRVGQILRFPGNRPER